jgi:hypothetical protein
MYYKLVGVNGFLDCDWVWHPIVRAPFAVDNNINLRE